MLLCDVQLINSYICKPLDLLVAETALEKKTPSAGRPWPVGVPSGGLVPFVLFSDLLATDEREQLAEKLCSYPPPSQPLQPHRYTAADARLPRYDARHKTF